jgi:hypothetical protein
MRSIALSASDAGLRKIELPPITCEMHHLRLIPVTGRSQAKKRHKSLRWERDGLVAVIEIARSGRAATTHQRLKHCGLQRDADT